MVLMANEGAGADRIAAWQCIGCGKIDGPQTCIGICQDRKVDFVYASLYDEALARTELIRRRAELLEAIVRRLASTTPREGEWERSYRAMLEQARRAMAVLTEEAASAP